MSRAISTPFAGRTAAGIACALCISGVTACPTEYTLHKIDDETAQEYSDLCSEVCSEQAPYVALVPGCMVTGCGVEAGGAGHNGRIDDILAEGPEGTCEIVTQCPEGPCYDRYYECLEDNGTPSACLQVFDDCELENECLQDRTECEAEADADYSDCIEQSGQDCDFWYSYDLEYCGCLYDECVNPGSDYRCGALPQLPPPPPLHTGPQRWTLSRALIDHHIARLGSLATATGAWPVVNASGEYAGVRLASLQPGDVLWNAGLRNGDVLKSVNNVSIAQAVEHPAWLMSLRDGDLVMLGLHRAGIPRQHRYDIVE